MKITDEMLSAFIDGELAQEEAERLREAIEEDENLAARLDRIRVPDAFIAAAYGAIDKDQIPKRILALLEDRPANTKPEGGRVVAFPGARILRAPRQWAAPMAASVALAIGVGVGLQLAPAPRSSVMLTGLVDAQSALHQALAATPSGRTVSLGGGDTLTPVLSFQAKDGRYCREFSVSSPAHPQRAVACAQDGLWRIEVAIAHAPASGAGYATASSGFAAQFDAIIDGAMAGEALDGEAELEMIAQDWTRN